MKFFLSIPLILFSLSACAPSVAPIDEVAQVQSKKEAVREVAPVRKTVEYQCKGGKIVRVQSPYGKKSKKIVVSFNQLSHKLSPIVAQNGKKYSNIRWTWSESAHGIGTLHNNRQAILAEKCVKKELK